MPTLTLTDSQIALLTKIFAEANVEVEKTSQPARRTIGGNKRADARREYRAQTSQAVANGEMAVSPEIDGGRVVNPLEMIAPTDRPYSAEELTDLGTRKGAINLKAQANSIRPFLFHQMIGGQEVQGIALYRGMPFKVEGKVVSGRACDESEIIVISFEQMYTLFDPKNLTHRQPFPYKPDQWRNLNGKAAGVGQTFVIKNVSITDIRTGEKHGLGDQRFYTFDAMWDVFVASRIAPEPGRQPNSAFVEHQRLFVERAITLDTIAKFDWLLAHISCARNGGSNSAALESARQYMRLPKPRQNDQGQWLGYRNDDVLGYYHDLEAFGALRQRNFVRDTAYRAERIAQAEQKSVAPVQPQVSVATPTRRGRPPKAEKPAMQIESDDSGSDELF